MENEVLNLLEWWNGFPRPFQAWNGCQKWSLQHVYSVQLLGLVPQWFFPGEAPSDCHRRDFSVSRYVKMTFMLLQIRKICKNCQKWPVIHSSKSSKSSKNHPIAIAAIAAIAYRKTCAPWEGHPSSHRSNLREVTAITAFFGEDPEKWRNHLVMTFTVRHGKSPCYFHR